MAFQYSGVGVKDVQYAGQDVDVLQFGGVTVWKRQKLTTIVPATNSFNSQRGYGGGLPGGSITGALGTTVTELTVLNFNHQAKLSFAGNVRPFGASTILVRHPDGLFNPSISFTWNGRFYSGKDSGAGQFFSALQPGKQVALEFEVTG